MGTASVTTLSAANLAPTETGPSFTHSGSIIAAFRKTFTDDARKTLARELRISTSAAEKKLNGQRSLSLDEFCRLLRTDEGFAYLTAAMADSRAKWWRVCVPLMEVAEVQAMQIAARRRLARAVKGAIDADADITAALTRADALLVQDEDFHRPQADALRAVARVSDRAGTAPAERQRR